MAKQKTPRKPRTPKPRQQFLPGTEPLCVPEIDKAADEYRAARDMRMDALKEEIALQDVLLGKMHEHKLNVYEYDGYVVVVAPKEKVSVKRKPGANGEADDE